MSHKYSFSSGNIAASSMAAGDCIYYDLIPNPWTGYEPFQTAVNSISNFKVSIYVFHVF